MRYLKIFFFFLFVFWGTFPLFSQQSVVLDRENTDFTHYEKIQFFYQRKAWLARQQAQSLREHYNALSFSHYPRVSYQDVIEGLPPYHQKGVLFEEALLNTWEELRDQPRPDSFALAQAVFERVVFSSHSRPVAQESGLSANVIMDSAFGLSSLYVQLDDYIRFINNHQADYQSYLKHKANNDIFYLSAYNEQDFRICKKGVDTSVFLHRQQDIDAFFDVYTRRANLFVRRVLLPLQTHRIEKADIRRYLYESIAASSLGPGIEKSRFIQYLLNDLPSTQQLYAKAEKSNPSFSQQIQAAHRVLSPYAVKKGLEDILVSLSLFEYISVGTLVDRLDIYGKIPSREQTLSYVAEHLAAAYLNKKLAEIADALYEYEKPFYYSYVAGPSADKIGQNWYDVAVHENYSSFMISKIAADNLLQSGRRSYQKGLLQEKALERQMRQNAQIYRDALPIITDVLAGDALVNMAVLWPFSKGGIREAMQAAKGKISKMFSSTPRPAKVITKSDLARVKRMSLVQREEGIPSAVWRLSDRSDDAMAYLKYGSSVELQNTKRVQEIIENSHILEKLKHIEVQYPKILAEGMSDLPDFATYKVVSEMDDLMLNVRSAPERIQQPFILTAVDTRGMSMVKMYSGKIKPEDALYFYLGGQPITKAEWDEIVTLYQVLNQNGFIHDDLHYNLFLMRNEKGKLRLSIIDFEPISRAPNPQTDMNVLSFFYTFLLKNNLAVW